MNLKFGHHHYVFCTANTAAVSVSFPSGILIPVSFSCPAQLESRHKQLSRPLKVCLAGLSPTQVALAGHDAAKKVTCKEQPSAVTQLLSRGISGVRSLHL